MFFLYYYDLSQEKGCHSLYYTGGPCLSILNVYNSLYLLTPNSPSIPLSPTSLLETKEKQPKPSLFHIPPAFCNCVSRKIYVYSLASPLFLTHSVWLLSQKCYLNSSSRGQDFMYKRLLSVLTSCAVSETMAPDYLPP